MASLTVATWNLHQAVDRRPANIEATWRFLSEQIAPSVALVQEVAGLPQGLTQAVISYGDDIRFGTAVIGLQGRVEPVPEVKTRYSSRRFSVAPRVPATFAAARVLDLPGIEPFVAISAYGLLSPIYAQLNVLRAIADLIPLFDAPAFNRRIVLGGDLNVWDQDPRDPHSVHRWRVIFQLIESLGLVNLLQLTRANRGPLRGCPCQLPECWHVETYRPTRQWRAGVSGFWTLDYLFATRQLADRLTALEVWNDREDAWALSDHIPVVARFDL